MNSEFERGMGIISTMLKIASPIAKRLLSPKMRPYLFGVGTLVMFVLVILFWPPQRSTAAYCKAWNEGANKLQGHDSTSYANEYATFYANLERVAPDDIRPDVRVQKLTYQKIAKDPTQALAGSVNGISANSSVDDWNRSHCPSSPILNQ